MSGLLRARGCCGLSIIWVAPGGTDAVDLRLTPTLRIVITGFFGLLLGAAGAAGGAVRTRRS